MDTPSQKLAKKIVDRLVREKLVTQQDADKIFPKLADGKLQAEDWRLPLELNKSKGEKQ